MRLHISVSSSLMNAGAREMSLLLMKRLIMRDFNRRGVRLMSAISEEGVNTLSLQREIFANVCNVPILRVIVCVRFPGDYYPLLYR